MKRTIVSMASCVLVSAVAHGQSTERISVDSLGQQASEASLASYSVPTMSADSRFVVFSSGATSFVAGDVNDADDVFVRDRQTGQTICVSLDLNGVPGDSVSTTAAISAYGQHVAFVSAASGLVPLDSNEFTDAFVRDLHTGVTTRVSVDSSGAQGDLPTTSVSISGDGRYVLFDSWATNLVAGTTTVNGVYVHDRQTGVTTRVSVNSSGEESNADASLGTISADGRWVSFSSSATNLVPNDTNGASDVFLHDRQTGETTCVSVDPNGLPGNQFSSHSALSTDARYVAYRSAATNLVPGDTNLAVDVFVYERLTGDVTRESVDSSGVQATGDSFEPSLSADGRFVAFHSDAANLVASDTNAALDVFVRDRSTNQTTCASVTQSGNVGDAQSYQASISPDGRYVAFASEASLLVLGDANLVLDVYLRDRGEVPITRFCAGDATLAPCPCDNTGDPGRGCASSLFAAGGSLNGSGTPSVAADTLLLQSQDLTGTHCVFAQSDAQTPATVIDDGLGCLSGTLIRLGTNALVGGTTTYPQAGDLPVSVKGQIGPTGGTRYYQAYYRNAAAAFCPPAFSNRTNGLIVIWSP